MATAIIKLTLLCVCASVVHSSSYYGYGSSNGGLSIYNGGYFDHDGKDGKDDDFDNCNCQNGGFCTNGRCDCPAGYIGVRCENKCSSGFFGKNCRQVCQCFNNAECDSVTGICECQSGFTGIACGIGCSGRSFGDQCRSSCPCANNALCNAITGDCDCSTISGYFGTDCSQRKYL